MKVLWLLCIGAVKDLEAALERPHQRTPLGNRRALRHGAHKKGLTPTHYDDTILRILIYFLESYEPFIARCI